MAGALRRASLPLEGSLILLSLDTLPTAEDAGRAAALPGQRRLAAPSCALSGHHHVMPCRVRDSTGIKVRGEGEWHARKHGGARRRVWRKVHLAMDEATLEVRAVEITGSGVGDAPVLPDLLGQVPADEEIASVTADGAYDTRGCRDAIANRGADAVIPPRRNAKPWKKHSPGAAGRNEALRAIKRLGRTIWRRWSGYHRRSRAETKMNCMKLLGQKLMAVRHRPRTDGGSMPHLRQTNRRTPGPHRHPQSLHRPRHPHHATCRLIPTGERGSSAFRRSVQQSRPAGELRPIQRQTFLHEGGGKIGSVRKRAFGDETVAIISADMLGIHDLSLAQPDHRRFRLPPPRLIHFRRVDARQADMRSGNDDRVAVDHVAFSREDLLFIRRGGGRRYSSSCRGRRCADRHCHRASFRRIRGMSGERLVPDGRNRSGFLGRCEETCQKSKHRKAFMENSFLCRELCRNIGSPMKYRRPSMPISVECGRSRHPNPQVSPTRRETRSPRAQTPPGRRASAYARPPASSLAAHRAAAPPSVGPPARSPDCRPP
ncbi:Transposase DDE domain protein [Jannaschia seosinensis]|uniref:Transposase DDE domain protein n=1 Tax=Jannaschia seosinensis TaxID=313367 RepID=A0A0M7BDJ3_9RHOB|nr:Transposase DDE domain protein [Jannaschia seosinensis]